MGPELVLVTRSPEATESVGEALGKPLQAGAVVALDGELGAGKTCLVRGLARGLGVQEPVSSPSFTLMHEYRGRLTLHHFDAWMAGREQAFLEAGGAEALDGDGVAVVEWAERVRAYLPAARLSVRLEHLAPELRRITLALLGPPGARPDLARALAAAARAPGAEAGTTG
jgi:tRNA threonylcarbamoyladenosine biosynthesis protein TsaE